MGFSSGQAGQFALAGQIGGAATSAAGTYYSAKLAQSSARSAAKIAEINARIAESGAENVLAQGQREEQNARLKTGQLKNAQKVAMAANGIDLGSETATNLLTTTDVMGEIDANTIAANAVRSAWGYRTQATNYQNDALLKRATASGISPVGSAASSLLGSAGQVAGSWYMMNKAGALKNTAFELKE